MYELHLNRLFDLAVTAVASVVLSPVLGAAAIGIHLEDRGPVLFRQVRVGKNGNTFVVYKFRTMPVDTDAMPSAMAPGLKVTRAGAILRRLSLDELPQLINVLRGEMSIVGPRPALASQGELCSLRRGSPAFRCLPGMTGLAQVNSYDGMPDFEKVKWDVQYAERVSFSSDVRILARTLAYLRKRPPVY